MAVASLKQVLDPAFEERYGVAAINIVDDLSLQSVIAAAEVLEAPLIVQTSLKTVKSIGAPVLSQLFRARAEAASVPVALHLDHCPEREWISICLQNGWNSVLFDGSHLDVEENRRQTAEVVQEAARYDAQVEGEIETVRGVEDGVGSDEGGLVHPIEISDGFIADTGVYAFAPAIGTAHGMYAAEPHLMPERVTELVARQPIPMVLHGGTGLAREQFEDLIARGCAKVNISTALKIAYTDAARAFLDANPAKHDPPSLFRHVSQAVQAMAEDHISMFGSAGKATAVQARG
ncbi:class II fructose-bisphosphate aldolase [Conexibacter sp. CPCC 206217]|uniref:class II fructose-bisphosphate aldolase n=1 Tax=Conexibacter sp. CPCC 206217 TaxID=3064574 RepID=UPI002715F8B8|nr:class II fructose-bisphosphate aldolase [Conexibacter sp. CPCC 206217]MDO8210667.1 class II fructose-bisphosphate aldolase [Conexibacter sp. CPCC 206217]